MTENGPYIPAEHLYDTIDGDTKHAIRKKAIRGPEGSVRDIDVDATKLFQPAERRTGNREILKIEYRLQQEGVELETPAAPADKQTAAWYNQWRAGQNGADSPAEGSDDD